MGLRSSCLCTGLPAPEHSLEEDPAPEQPSPGPRLYSAQSLGGSGGAPTALTGDTDMNGDMEGDYSSSSSEPEEEAEEDMSSGEDSDEESESPDPARLGPPFTGCHFLHGCLSWQGCGDDAGCCPSRLLCFPC